MTPGVVRRVGPKRALALALLLIICVPSVGLTQETRGTKKYLYMVIGALVAAVPTYLLAQDDQFDNLCSNDECLAFIAGAAGAGVGYLIGSEMDAKYERRMAAGPTLDYDQQTFPLGMMPDRMTAFPNGAAVIGLQGARIVSTDGTITERGVGVRGLEDLAVLPELNLLVLSTFSSLIGFSIDADTAPGQVIDERGGGAMEVFQDRLAIAGFDSIRVFRVRQTTQGFSVETLAAMENVEFVTDMTFNPFQRTAWILLEDRVVAYTSDLEKVADLQLPAAGRTVRARGDRLVVAAGTEGVYVLNATDPRAPRVVQHYTGVRFAYAADLDGDRLYVAAGPEGLAVVDISGSSPTVVGVARDVQFANDVVTAGSGKAWILDRDGHAVQIATFGNEAAAESGR